MEKPLEESQLELESKIQESNTSSELAKLLNLENISTHNLYLGFERDCSTTASSLLSSSSSQDGEERDLDYGSLDRYGFLIVDGQTRIASVAGASSTTTGGQRANTIGNSSLVQRLLGHEPKAKQNLQVDLNNGKREREARRAIKWVKMLQRLTTNPQQLSISTWPQRHRKFEERLVKGIPDCLRTRVWSLFLDSVKSSNKDNNYRELYLRISGFERQIDLDIERTLRDHVMFKMRFSSAQISLFKMLVAYSNLDPAVGYCQGMSNVAAFLLLYFDEETAFDLLVRLLWRDGLRLLYMSGFGLLFEAFFIQERLMAKLTPLLEARLGQLGIGPSVYATKWYLTLFLSFPVSLSNRVWDLFLFYGFDWLIVLAVALLGYHEDTLLRLDYEPAMQFLSHLPEQPVNETGLIRLAMRIWHRLVDGDGQRSFSAVLLDRLSIFDQLRKAYAIMQQK